MAFTVRGTVAAAVLAAVVTAGAVTWARMSHHAPPARIAAAVPAGPQPTAVRAISGPVPTACDAADFRVIRQSHDTSGDASVVTAVVRNGGPACSMPGHGPVARLLNAGGDVLGVGSDSTASAIRPVVVPRGASVPLSAFWYASCYHTSAATLQFFLAGPQPPRLNPVGDWLGVPLAGVPVPPNNCATESPYGNVTGRAIELPVVSVVLIVRVAFSGGPIRSDGTMALNNTPEADQQVTVTGPGYLRTAVTNRVGEVKLLLPTGAYTAKAGCSPPVHVTLAAAARTVQLRCDVG